MHTHSKLKYFTYILTAVVLLFLALYFKDTLREKVSLQPSGENKTSEENNTPGYFPKGIIAEGNTELKYSNEEIPGGKDQTSVSFVSKDSPEEVMARYKTSLTAEGWVISRDGILEGRGILQAKKDGHILILSVNGTEEGTDVVFEYKE